MQAYPSEIPSIFSKHPNLPGVLTDILNLNARLDEGQPLVQTAAKEAEDTVTILERHQSKTAMPCALPSFLLNYFYTAREPAITSEVIETARNRATVIRDIRMQPSLPTGFY
jgi:hypothetical protein